MSSIIISHYRPLTANRILQYVGVSTDVVVAIRRYLELTLFLKKAGFQQITFVVGASTEWFSITFCIEVWILHMAPLPERITGLPADPLRWTTFCNESWSSHRAPLPERLSGLPVDLLRWERAARRTRHLLCQEGEGKLAGLQPSLRKGISSLGKRVTRIKLKNDRGNRIKMEG